MPELINSVDESSVSDGLSSSTNEGIQVDSRDFIASDNGDQVRFRNKRRAESRARSLANREGLPEAAFEVVKDGRDFGIKQVSDTGRVITNPDQVRPLRDGGFRIGRDIFDSPSLTDNGSVVLSRLDGEGDVVLSGDAAQFAIEESSTEDVGDVDSFGETASQALTNDADVPSIDTLDAFRNFDDILDALDPDIETNERVADLENFRDRVSERADSLLSVSYTHLTLPTIYSV